MLDSGSVLETQSIVTQEPQELSGPSPHNSGGGGKQRLKPPVWANLYLNAPDPTRDPESDSAFTMLKWADLKLFQQHYIASSKFRNLGGAVVYLLSVVDNPADFTVARLKVDVGDLGQRWANQNWSNKNPERTQSDYKRRVLQLIEEYERWCSDTANYKCGLSFGKSKRRKKAEVVASPQMALFDKDAKPCITVPVAPSAEPIQDSEPIQEKEMPPWDLAPEPQPAPPVVTPATGFAVEVNLDSGKQWVVPCPDDIQISDVKRLMVQLFCKMRQENLALHVSKAFDQVQT